MTSSSSFLEVPTPRCDFPNTYTSLGKWIWLQYISVSHADKQEAKRLHCFQKALQAAD